MENNDTQELLRECNAGIEMAIYSIDDILEGVSNKDLKQLLENAKAEHVKLETQTHTLLNESNALPKAPNPMAKGMSYMKTNMKMAMDKSNQVIADLIVDGCNMGIKSLYRYRNQYTAANKDAKDLALNVIRCEEQLRQDISNYL